MNPLVYRPKHGGVYIHFPYCVHKCAYCDFYSVGVGLNGTPDQKDLFENYRLEFFKRLNDDPEIKNLNFDTIFIGGGTPSLSDKNKLKEFIRFLFDNLNFEPDTEISLEANPEDVSLELLEELKSIGFNRINIGIQTFNPDLLKKIDRYYDPIKYQNVLSLLSSSIIDRFGIDLIYGIAGQTEKNFYEDLDIAISNGVNHISAYSLTVEKGTKYSRNIKEKFSLPPDEDLQIRILENLPEYLKKYNFQQYEVSNFSFPENQSKHNLKYWTMEYYLALGPGAHGFLPKGRYSNPRSVESYNKKKFGDNYESGVTMEEVALCIFRNFSPIDINSFLNGFGIDSKLFNDLFYSWAKKGICKTKGNIFQWEPKAILNLDSFILDFVEFKSFPRTN